MLITIDVRPEVAKFAQLMETVLKENDHKTGWDDMSDTEILVRIYEELEELNEAIANGNPSSNIAVEAADVANFCMMLFDNLSRK